MQGGSRDQGESMAASDLRHDILDALIDCGVGGSPFASIFGEVREDRSGHLEVYEALDELQHMEDDGLVTAEMIQPDGAHRATEAFRRAAVNEYSAWLPTEQDFGKMADDRVGLWFSITDGGCLPWRAGLPADYMEPLMWRSEAHFDVQPVLTIYAENEAAVEEAKDGWSTHISKGWVALWDEQRIEPLDRYALRADRIIINGIKIVVPLLKEAE